MFYVLTCLFVSFLWGLAPFLILEKVKTYDSDIFLFMSSCVFFILMVAYIVLSPGRLKKLNQMFAKIYDVRFLGWVFITYILAAIMYYKLLADTRYPTAITVALTSLAPLFAAFFGSVFISQPLTPLQLLGVALVSFGIIFIQMAKK